MGWELGRKGKRSPELPGVGSELPPPSPPSTALSSLLPTPSKIRFLQFVKLVIIFLGGLSFYFLNVNLFIFRI